jgi:hypothetical protein
VVALGVGLVLAVVVANGVGVMGVPGHREMFSRKGPGVATPAHKFTKTPPWRVWQFELPPPPPQLHESAPATSIIAVAIRIQRALPPIGNQL